MRARRRAPSPHSGTVAGACVPEHGDYRYCRGGRKYRFNRTGICTKTTTAC